MSRKRTETRDTLEASDTCALNSMRRSERNSQGELQNAGHVGSGRVQKVVGGDVRIHSRPLRVVEHVEGLGTELHVDILFWLENFVDGYIEVRAPGIVEAIPAGITEGQSLGLGVGGAVK